MKIDKNLKYATFSYDEADKTFTITEQDGNRVILNKVYSFAFMRFVIRMAQRNWLRTKKIIDNTPESVIQLEDLDGMQQVMFEEYEELEPVSSEQGLH